MLILLHSEDDQRKWSKRMSLLPNLKLFL